MKKQHKFSIWYALIGIWLVLLFHNFIVSMFATRTIPYSEFIDLANQNRIEEIAVSEKFIQGKLRSGDSAEQQSQTFRTVRVDRDITELLTNNNIRVTGRVESDFLKNLMSWLIPMALFLGFWFFIISRMQRQQAGFMSLGKNKGKVYMEEDVRISFQDVAGVDEARLELEEVLHFLKSPEHFTRIGGQIPRGILLVGPPGTGKTLLAKAVAGESKVPFFSLSGSEFVELFVGMGAARVRDLFKQAKEKAPCIIFIDELDALGKARGIGGIGGHDEREQTLNQLLVELDGFKANEGVLLMAATNRPEILDPALLRPGRFDRQVLVDRPDKAGRAAILEIYINRVKSIEAIDIEKAAAMTAGMVGADLANVVNEAALLAVRKGKDGIGNDDINEAMERIIAGLEKKQRLINPEEKRTVAYHELGHAIVAMSLDGTDPVQKISIIPRGIAALGYTMQLPTDDRFLLRKTELENRIATLLGGRAAEAIVFKDVSTGAQNDLSRATDIARSMVAEYGMSQKLGQVYYAPQRKAAFLNSAGDSGEPFSEQTSKTIDEEIKAIIDEQYEAAYDILIQNRDLLDEWAEKLLKKEVLEGNLLELLKSQIDYPKGELQ